MMTKTRSSSLRAVAVAVICTVTVAGASGCGSDDPDPTTQHTGSDAGMTDPSVGDPGVIAQGVSRILLTWNPAERSSPYDVPESVASQTSGTLRRLIDDPAGKDARRDTPSAWNDWKAANATIAGFVDTPKVTEEGDKRTVTMGFTQRLDYPDGSSSTYRRGTVIATVIPAGDSWTVDDLSIRERKDKE